MSKKSSLEHFENIVVVTYVAYAPVAMFVGNMWSSDFDLSITTINNFGFLNERDFIESFPGKCKPKSAIVNVLNYHDKHYSASEYDIKYYNRDDCNPSAVFMWYLHNIGLICSLKAYKKVTGTEDYSNHIFDFTLFRNLSVYPTLKEMKHTISYHSAGPKDRKWLRYSCIDWKPLTKKERAAFNEQV